MSLFETIQQDPPVWANETIRNWSEVFPEGASEFVVRESFKSDDRVDMREVVGQCDHYASQTWLQAAVNPKYRPGKMAHAFALYDQNPEYYFNGELAHSDSIYLSSANGSKWFTDSGGNHRTVVAKFACDRRFRDAKENGEYPCIRGAVTHQYQVDFESRDLYEQLRRYEGKGVAARVERREVSKKSTGSVTVIESALTFFVADYRYNSGGRSQNLGASEFRKFARHFLSREGKVERWDRLRHLWLGYARGDFNSLIYPA